MLNKRTGPRKAPPRGETEKATNQPVTESHRGTKAPLPLGRHRPFTRAHGAFPRGGCATPRAPEADSRGCPGHGEAAPPEPGASRSRLGAACDFLSGSSSRLGRPAPPPASPGPAVSSFPHRRPGDPRTSAEIASRARRRQTAKNRGRSRPGPARHRGPRPAPPSPPPSSRPRRPLPRLAGPPAPPAPSRPRPSPATG